MCLAVSGVLTECRGVGMTRVGMVETDQGPTEIILTYLPDALPGDVVLFHSGIGFRIVERPSAIRASRSG